jgi:hypothetical protein
MGDGLRNIVHILASVGVAVFYVNFLQRDRLCGLVVKVPGYRFRGPGSIPGATRFF